MPTQQRKKRHFHLFKGEKNPLLLLKIVEKVFYSYLNDLVRTLIINIMKHIIIIMEFEFSVQKLTKEKKHTKLHKWSFLLMTGGFLSKIF